MWIYSYLLHTCVCLFTSRVNSWPSLVDNGSAKHPKKRKRSFESSYEKSEKVSSNAKAIPTRAAWRCQLKHFSGDAPACCGAGIEALESRSRHDSVSERDRIHEWDPSRECCAQRHGGCQEKCLSLPVFVSEKRGKPCSEKVGAVEKNNFHAFSQPRVK